MNTKRKGIIFTVIATMIFGITPAIGKLTYSMGNNGIQLTFLRNLFVFPLFLFVIARQELSLRLSKRQFFDVVRVGFFGYTLAIVMLYSSYAYIGVGSATVLHFLYPLFVCLMNFIFYHKSLTRSQLLCLVLALIGVCCFIDQGINSMMGFVLAVASGLFFAYYMVGMDHSSIRELNPYVFNFYLIVMNVIGIFFLALITNSFTIMPIGGYVLTFCVAILTSCIGVLLLQRGIYCLGASLTAILSTLEPITSVIVGMIWLHESLTILKLIGCLCVLISTFILVKQNQD